MGAVLARCRPDLEPVYFGLAIVFVVTTIIGKRLDAQRKLRATYMLSNGGLNSICVILDAELCEAGRQRILSAYGAALLTCTPAFDPTGVADIQPERRHR